MMARLRPSCFAAILSIACPALAEETGPPLSSIDWLSDSIAAPPFVGPVETDEGDAVGRLPPSVNVTSLDAPLPDEAGTIAVESLGLPSDLWASTPAAEVAGTLASLPSTLPPAAARFLRDVLLARADAPIDARVDDSLFIARVDKLLEIGHLQDALDLMDSVDADTDPRLFRRRFDIALLTGEENEGCRVLDETPDILPTFPARIFCLARNGKWDVAALTLGTAETLGYLTPEEDALLLKFLDPELFEGDPLPPTPATPTPLVFRLYDAIGERLPTEPLPIAFAEADLRPTVGWKTQLRAAERLTAANAMSIDTFFGILFERAPAASGGIWDRVDALQKADVALRKGDKVDRVLTKGWRAAHMAGIAPALAPRWADRLVSQSLDGTARAAAFEIALLAGRRDLARRFVGDSPEDQALLEILTDQPATLPGNEALSRAVRRGLVQIGLSDRYQQELEDRGPGMALLTAMKLISEGRAGDPDAVGDALSILRALGLKRLAAQTAVELLLEDRTA